MRIGVSGGLSQSVVNCIMQDQQGFLWFGTQDGLNRYDGYDIRIFKHSAADTATLSDNSIWSLCRDRSGDIWIGTMHGGLDRYSVAHDRFVHSVHNPADSTSISENNVTSVFQDSHGALWVGTLNSGLNRLDPGASGFVRFRHNPADSTSLSDNAVWSICEDGNGDVWVATWRGLNRYDQESGRFEQFRHDPRNPSSLASDNVRTLLVDRRNRLWVGTWGGGLDRFDRRDGKFIHHRRQGGSAAGLGSSKIYSLLQDGKGILWVGTGDSGLVRLDLSTGAIARYAHDPVDGKSLSDNVVTSLYEDDAGSLWIGTGAGGVSRFDWLKNRFVHYRDDPNTPDDLTGNDVWSILEDHTGDLWIGTYGNGLNRYDRERGRFTLYRNNPKDPGSISHNTVLALCECRNGDLWVGTEGGGLNRFNRATGRFTRYAHDSRNPYSLIADEVTTIREDREGLLWIGTNGSGLDRFDPVTGKFTHFRPAPRDSAGLATGAIMTVFEDRAGVIWVGTWGGGVCSYDRARNTFRRYQHSVEDSTGLNNPSVLSIYQEQSGIFWFGTYGGGLNRYDPLSRVYTYVTDAAGLPSNVVYGIIPDAHGNLWLSTNRGISRFDPRAGTLKNYDVDDGLQGNEFNMGSFFRTGKGEILVGGINGVNAFFPDGLQDNPYVPPVYLTSFKVFDKNVRLEDAITVTRQMELSYAQNFFSFEFVALNYTSSDKNTYAYMLEGLDEEWIQAGTRRYASYTNLDPGSYVLRVKAANNDGRWNEEGIRVAVTITPPYWRTWWFIVIAAGAIIALAIVLYRYRVKKLLEIERIRTSIATDLHDDIGSTLTEMALFSDVALRELKSRSGDGKGADADMGKVSGLLREIGSTSRTLIDAMNDIVWAVDPKNDSFEFLLLRMKTHAGRVLEAKGINYEIDIPPELAHLRLPLGFRRRFFLVFKEALNNVLKHAAPTRVMLTIKKEKRLLLMTIGDNGIGFDPKIHFQGNGLRNMKERALSLNGDLTITSAPSSGTMVSLRVPIP